MEISLITALTIQGNGAEVATYQGENGKCGYEIYSPIRENYWAQLKYKPIYESSEIAMKKGERMIDRINSLDLGEKIKRLSYILGDDSESIGKVVSASKSR